MRIPRDMSAEDLISLLRRFEYKSTRQTGSHIRLTTAMNGEHHITIPRHTPLKVGTLSSILKEIASYLETDSQHIIEELFS